MEELTEVCNVVGRRIYYATYFTDRDSELVFKDVFMGEEIEIPLSGRKAD